MLRGQQSLRKKGFTCVCYSWKSAAVEHVGPVHMESICVCISVCESKLATKINIYVQAINSLQTVLEMNIKNPATT